MRWVNKLSDTDIEKLLKKHFTDDRFGRECLIDLIRNKTGLSGKFLRKKLR